MFSFLSFSNKKNNFFPYPHICIVHFPSLHFGKKNVIEEYYLHPAGHMFQRIQPSTFDFMSFLLQSKLRKSSFKIQVSGASGTRKLKNMTQPIHFYYYQPRLNLKSQKNESKTRSTRTQNSESQQNPHSKLKFFKRVKKRKRDKLLLEEPAFLFQVQVYFKY